MIGHGSVSDHKQEKAVVALLESPTVEAAATSVGISTASLYRWLRDPVFKARYREARSALLENAIAGLQQIASEAVATLKTRYRVV